MTDTPLLVAELETWIERTLQATGAPGAAVVLERNGETLLARGFGYRDAEAGLKADVDTVFGTGSITKSLTALAILLLEADGRLATGDAVGAYLPELRLPGPGDVKIHHLLAHTSGLPPLPSRHYAWLSQDDLESFERERLERLPARAPIRSFDELIAFLGDYPVELHAAPGDRYSYSNEGYNLLGAIIERVSGRSLPAFVRDRILAPCGMTRSSLDLQFTLSLPNVTTLYVREGGKVMPSANWFNPACWVAAGGLRSTATDLVRYFRMLACGGVLDGAQVVPTNVVITMATVRAPKGDGSAYGYGLTLADLDGHAIAHHGGGHKGVSAMGGFVAAEGLVCVVLTNLAEAPALRLWTGCMRTGLGLSIAPPSNPAAPIALPPETLRGFAGVYNSPEGTQFEVAVNDAGDVRVSSGGLSTPAIPTADDAITFTAFGEEQTIRFARLVGGEVTHALQGGRLVKRDSAPAPAR